MAHPTDRTTVPGTPCRLITQDDFDGVVCAALLREQGLISEISFVHPQDVKDGLLNVGSQDILAGLPYRNQVYLAFNHQLSESLRAGEHENHVVGVTASSNARLIYDYFGGEISFPSIEPELIAAVDNAVAGRFSIDEVLTPSGWTLLTFVTDTRTGIGRFGTFRISTRQLMVDLVDYCRELTVDEILQVPDVAERVALYRTHNPLFKAQVQRCSRIDRNVLVTDLTEEDEVYAGNRFIKYALYPQVNCSVQKRWGFERQAAILHVGKSIFNRTCSLNVGALLLQYDGGGSEDSGMCQVEIDQVDRVLLEIVHRLHTDPHEGADTNGRR